jgi:hypothetical protein
MLFALRSSQPVVAPESFALPMLHATAHDRDVSKFGLNQQFGGLGGTLVGPTDDGYRPALRRLELANARAKFGQGDVDRHRDMPQRPAEFVRPTNVDHQPLRTLIELGPQLPYVDPPRTVAPKSPDQPRQKGDQRQ